MTKDEFLKSLEHVYTRLAPGEHGVGVVAIRDIPQGVNPFAGCSQVEVLAVTEEELAGKNSAVVKLIKDMCAKQGGVYLVPSRGIDSIEKNYYLNHSDTPNMHTLDEGDTFVALRDITEGEELTVDYRTYDEQPLGF